MTLSSAGAIRDALDLALADVPLRQECALLDYPAYPNIGDHMIWLGEVLYVTTVRRVKIRFAASLDEPLSLPGGVPILLSGGGNLGDLWPAHQNFRERIIRQYRDRPIVIMPQTMYFRDQAKLLKAAAAFNAHPDLTILIRDERSLEAARQAFGNCRVLLAPDMAFELTGRIDFTRKPLQKTSGLYHCRTDPEQPPGVSADYLGLSHLNISDWISTRRSLQAIQWELSGRFRTARALLRLAKEIARDPINRLTEWRAWREASVRLSLDDLPRPELHRKSWPLLHAGAWQFQRYPAIVTNRLHGHILCTLLGIPHVLLPNSYYKNEAFYRTWARGIPFCRFESDPRAAKGALAELVR